MSLSQRTEIKELLALTKLGTIVALEIITLVGLTGQVRLADPPAYKDVSTNLLNPWASWCSWNMGKVLGCFGTSYNHWGGPYSIMWYWSYALITLNGLLWLTPTLFVINLIIQVKIRKSRLAIPWAINCLFCLLSWPQNMIILYLLLASFYNWRFLIVAPAFKIPLGAPWPVWQFTFTSQYSLHDQGNWFVYGWLIVFWLSAFFYQFRHSRKVSLQISQQQTDPSKLYPVSDDQSSDGWLMEDQQETDW